MKLSNNKNAVVGRWAYGKENRINQYLFKDTSKKKSYHE